MEKIGFKPSVPGKTVIIVACFIFVCFPLAAFAAQVTLQWDENSPVPEGYHLFQRSDGGSFDYSSPVCTGSQTSCTVESLVDGQTYYFVVRAFEGSVESGNSNEVQFTPAALQSSNTDSDNDGIIDELDAFPLDPTEWKDSDGDGIGDNADSDDDNDGMPDDWELSYGLNPYYNDADLDLDGDGISNLSEYQNGTNPCLNLDNSPPLKPVLSQPSDGAVVDLLPVLVAGDFVDGDGDEHARTRYQISTLHDFSHLVFEALSAQHLTHYEIQDLILDPDTVYYWRVSYYDDRNGMSEWSDVGSFTTIDYEQAGDSNGNGVLDYQEIDMHIDLDADGTPDAVQAGMLSVATGDPVNPNVGVKSSGQEVQVVSIRALDHNMMRSLANQPELLTGLISFKLYLDPGHTTATITVFLSEPAPDNAQWYKYDIEQGWVVYPHAVLSEDRKSIALVLEDGGSGDQDGVQNGVIVDPAGLGYSRQTNTTIYSGSGSSGGGGCFIASSLNTTQGSFKGGMILICFAGLVLIAFLKIRQANQ